MAAASGISVSPDLEQKFLEVQGNSDTGFIKVVVNNESFEIVSENPSSSDNFAAARECLEKGKACYIIVRNPVDTGKWVLVLFVPDNARVRDKMLYASSAAALKAGFGSAKFSPDFHITTIDECNSDAYQQENKEADKYDIYTFREIDASAAEHESALMVNDVTREAVVSMPIKCSEQAEAAIKNIAVGDQRCAILSLNSKTEALDLEYAGDITPDQAREKVPDKEPRYLLLKFRHEKDGASKSTLIFYYYCADNCKPREKMHYSACKAAFIRLVTGFGGAIAKSFEVSSKDDISEKFLMEELYPRVEEKVLFAKPKPRGRGPVAKGAKFSMSPGSGSP